MTPARPDARPATPPRTPPPRRPAALARRWALALALALPLALAAVLAAALGARFAPAARPAAAPPAPTAAPPATAPAAAPQPLIPTGPRPGSGGQARALEEAYLAYLRAQGAALLDLDPGPLRAAVAGPALDALSREVSARREAGRPARLAVAGPRLAFYRTPGGATTVLVSYEDATDPVDPGSGRLRPREEPPALIWETLTLEEVDGGWMVVGRERHQYGHRPALPPAAGEDAPHSRTGYALREGVDAVADAAWLAGDPGRLPEVLSGAALREQTRLIEGFRASGLGMRNERRPAFVDSVVSGAAQLRVDEVVTDVSDLRPLAGDRRYVRDGAPPVLWRRLIFERAGGRWTCVEWQTWPLGTAIE